MTDDAGVPTDSYEYNAFGELLGEPDLETLGTDYLYAGQQFESVTELYSMRARYYDASVGRFMSRDTYAYNYGNPVELNRYTYARQNPVRYRDPSGNTSTTYTNILRSSTNNGNMGPNRNLGALMGGMMGTAVGYVVGLSRYDFIASGSCGSEMVQKVSRIGKVGFAGLSALSGGITGALFGFFAYEAIAGNISPAMVARAQWAIGVATIAPEILGLFFSTSDAAVCVVYDLLLTFVPLAVTGGGTSGIGGPGGSPGLNISGGGIVSNGSGIVGNGMVGGLVGSPNLGGFDFADGDPNDNGGGDDKR